MPRAIIDLNTEIGLKAVKGQWKFAQHDFRSTTTQAGRYVLISPSGSPTDFPLFGTVLT